MRPLFLSVASWVPGRNTVDPDSVMELKKHVAEEERRSAAVTPAIGIVPMVREVLHGKSSHQRLWPDWQSHL